MSIPMKFFNDARQYAPGSEHNCESILQVLQRVLPPKGHFLKIASGTGEHAIFFASKQPGQCFPSDGNPFDNESFDVVMSSAATRKSKVKNKKSKILIGKALSIL